MVRFKTGDKVKCVKAYEDWLTLGKEYVITQDYGCLWDTVCVDGDNGLNGGFDSDHFELIPEAPKFRVGMRVWDMDHGWGTVTRVDSAGTYPIYIECDFNNHSHVYTKDGKRYTSSLNPSLFLDEVKPEDWPNPPAPKPKASELKVGQHIECTTNFTNQQYLRRQVVFLAGDQVWVQDIYNENSAHKVTNWRLPSPE